MLIRIFILAMVALLGGITIAGPKDWKIHLNSQTRVSDTRSMRLLATATLHDNPKIAGSAIAVLRSHGPSSLRAMTWLKGRIKATQMPAFERALDRVAGQYRSENSGLFWFTDLKRAQKLARQQKKPILTLRLLGRLDQAYTCANSRFFRTVLYVDPAIARVLREQFVLHWKSVRPVPIITVDYGDGRKLKRTITGNSIHYVLDSRGRLVDALAGLHGPGAFARFLARSRSLVATANRLKNAAYLSWMRRTHRGLLNATTARWKKTLRTLVADVSLNGFINHSLLAAPLPLLIGTPPKQPPVIRKPPSARRPDRLSISKSRVERPILRRFVPKKRGQLQKLKRDVRGSAVRALRQLAGKLPWQRIATTLRSEARFGTQSIARIRSEYASLVAFGSRRINKTERQRLISEMVRQFQQSVALDTARNTFMMQPKLHHWFSRQSSLIAVDKLNEMVYDKLFFTPRRDPWMGMLAPNAYTALPLAGVKMP